jgi:hypothetical protein
MEDKVFRISRLSALATASLISLIVSATAINFNFSAITDYGNRRHSGVKGMDLSVVTASDLT